MNARAHTQATAAKNCEKLVKIISMYRLRFPIRFYDSFYFSKPNGSCEVEHRSPDAKGLSGLEPRTSKRDPKTSKSKARAHPNRPQDVQRRPQGHSRATPGSQKDPQDGRPKEIPGRQKVRPGGSWIDDRTSKGNPKVDFGLILEVILSTKMCNF